MGKSGYTSLSIEEKRYDKLRRNFETTIDTDLTFTKWTMGVLEGNIARMDFLNKTYPDYSVIKPLEHGIVINDSKTDRIVKVTMIKGKITCSDNSKNSENYIRYALLHPQFRVNIL